MRKILSLHGIEHDVRASSRSAFAYAHTCWSWLDLSRAAEPLAFREQVPPTLALRTFECSATLSCLRAALCAPRKQHKPSRCFRGSSSSRFLPPTHCHAVRLRLKRPAVGRPSLVVGVLTSLRVALFFHSAKFSISESVRLTFDEPPNLWSRLFWAESL